MGVDVKKRTAIRGEKKAGRKGAPDLVRNPD